MGSSAPVTQQQSIQTDPIQPNSPSKSYATMRRRESEPANSVTVRSPAKQNAKPKHNDLMLMIDIGNNSKIQAYDAKIKTARTSKVVRTSTGF